MQKKGNKRTVFVGSKKISSYITPAEAFLKEDGMVTVAGRGNAIVKVVDVVEVLKKSGEFEENVVLGTEVVLGHQNVKLNVSTLSISLEVKK